MTSPLRMGLVGAGPWASMVTGPMLANAPERSGELFRVPKIIEE